VAMTRCSPLFEKEGSGEICRCLLAEAVARPGHIME
jgi:hypothetical protein